MTDVAKRDDKRMRSVECPKCRTRFAFRRTGRVRFDARGFESYRFSCDSCGVFLIGIIDPFHGLMMVSTV
jgi:RNase P subunit RPR2